MLLEVDYVVVMVSPSLFESREASTCLNTDFIQTCDHNSQWHCYMNLNSWFMRENSNLFTCCLDILPVLCDENFFYSLY